MWIWGKRKQSWFLFNEFFLSNINLAVSEEKITCAFLVEGGHRAVIFDRFVGVKDKVIGEGTHFFIPWVQKPITYDIRSRPRNVPVITGSKG